MADDIALAPAPAAEPAVPADAANVLAQAKPVETPVESKPAEAPAAEKPAAEAPVLDIKALKLPEGFQADEKALGDFATLLQDSKLSPQERAQKLFDMHQQTLKSAAEGPIRFWEETQQKWQSEVAANKEFGSGDVKSPLKPEVVSQVAKVIDQFGGDDLRQALYFTGAGNNPAVIKAFVNIAKQLTEGRHVGGIGPAAPPKSAAEIMYPGLKGT
jgi:hypothetical protein